MASRFADARPPRPSRLIDGLGDPAGAIGGVRFDAVLLWGAPGLAFLFVLGWARVAASLPAPAGDRAVALLGLVVAVMTYAHLIAVVPRAYGNAQVFAAHRARLILGPVLLVGAMLASSWAMIAAFAVAVFWDMHHSAMQTFGIGRIYDMKAGNGATRLRRTDLVLASALYLGPLAAGAGLVAQLDPLRPIGALGWHMLTAVPGAAGTWAAPIRLAAWIGWGLCLGGAIIAYARASRHGYRLPPQKLALYLLTGGGWLAIWSVAPPLIAFAVSNIAHVLQYFAMIWLKERGGIAAIGRRARLSGGGPAFALFALGCIGFGALYAHVYHGGYRLVAVPFVACTLLHFWFDGFVWSVRARQV